jgi:hypothetical protein
VIIAPLRKGDGAPTGQPVRLVSLTLALRSENPNTGEPWHDERSQRDTFWAPTLKGLGIRSRRAYATLATYRSAALAARVPPGDVVQQAGHGLEPRLCGLDPRGRRRHGARPPC